jgi:hypothetical protein
MGCQTTLFLKVQVSSLILPRAAYRSRLHLIYQTRLRREARTSEGLDQVDRLLRATQVPAIAGGAYFSSLAAVGKLRVMSSWSALDSRTGVFQTLIWLRP